MLDCVSVASNELPLSFWLLGSQEYPRPFRQISALVLKECGAGLWALCVSQSVKGRSLRIRPDLWLPGCLGSMVTLAMLPGQHAVSAALVKYSVECLSECSWGTGWQRQHYLCV